MLEDRSYMRRARFESFRSATLLLLLLNLATFLVQLAGYKYSRFPITEYFALSLPGLRQGYVWQLLTFQLMHGGWIHLILNCWAIFMIGREVEEALGRRNFLTLYFSCGVLGGLVQILAGAFFPGRFGGPVVGASAGAFGLVAAFAMLYPERPLTLLIFYIIPVTMRAKFLLLFLAVAGISGLVFPGANPKGPHIAHAAHLGGMLAGIIFIRYAIHWHWPHLRRTSAPPPRRLAKVLSHKSVHWDTSQHETAEDLPPAEFLIQQVDPILDKINAQGIGSLTERERRILEAARGKVTKN